MPAKVTVAPQDEVEALARKYDNNKNGTWSLDEVKLIASDLLVSNQQRRRIKTLSFVLAGVVVFLLVSNFGLVMAGMAITRQLGTSTGSSGATPSLQDRSGQSVGTRQMEAVLPGMEELKPYQQTLCAAPDSLGETCVKIGTIPCVNILQAVNQVQSGGEHRSTARDPLTMYLMAALPMPCTTGAHGVAAKLTSRHASATPHAPHPAAVYTLGRPARRRDAR